jgi:hypothetical protein
MGYPNPSDPGSVIGGCLCISDGNLCGFYPYFTTTYSNHVYLTSLIIKCFPIESVLLSTLECWYDPDCMALLRDYYAWAGVPTLMNISLLVSTIHSRFSINTTIEVLMQALFLENWTLSFSYDQYYITCAPISCTFTIEQQFDLFLFIVTAVAVYGGLNKGLRMLIPLLVIGVSRGGGHWAIAQCLKIYCPVIF